MVKRFFKSCSIQKNEFGIGTKSNAGHEAYEAGTTCTISYLETGDQALRPYFKFYFFIDKIAVFVQHKVEFENSFLCFNLTTYYLF